MAAPKRSFDQIQRDRAEIARLYLQGVIQAEIGQHLNMTQQMVSYDLQAIRKEWLASSIRDFDEARAQELAKIDNLEITYWQAWERSLEEFKTKTVKQKGAKIECTGKNEETKITPVEATQKAEERNGDPRYLQGVQWCIDRRCKILGFDAPRKFELTGWQKELLDLLKQGKITPADVTDELGADLAQEFFQSVGLVMVTNERTDSIN